MMVSSLQRRRRQLYLESNWQRKHPPTWFEVFWELAVCAGALTIGIAGGVGIAAIWFSL